MLGEVKEAIKLWGQDDETTPRLLNKKAVHKAIGDNIQIGDQAIDFMDFVVYSLIMFVIKDAKRRKIKRLSPKSVRDILAEERALNINIGSVSYINLEDSEAENRIVEKVYRKIIMTTFGSRDLKKKLDLDSIEFPDVLDGENNE